MLPDTISNIQSLNLNYPNGQAHKSPTRFARRGNYLMAPKVRTSATLSMVRSLWKPRGTHATLCQTL